MGTNTYLDKLTRALPTAQGKQILRLLTSERDSGKIKTIDEFKDRLKQLTTTLLEKRIKPTFKLWRAVAGEEISEELYNDMLNKVYADLTVAFDEANSLDEIIEAHRQLIQQVSFKTLHYGINQLESQISLYEFIEKNSYGVDDCTFNTFRSTDVNGLSRADEIASVVFIDPRQATAINSTQDAAIDLIGERLTLGAATSTYLTPKRAVFLANSSSIRSELDVQFENSNINNVVDGRKNTYWAIPILVSNIQSSGVTIEVQIDLNASQDINFIEIDPASYFPMVLSTISYVNSNQTRTTITSPNALLTGPKSFSFGKVATSSIILTFKQDNYKETQITKKSNEVNFYKALTGDTFAKPSILNAKDDIKATITSDFLLNQVFNLPDDEVEDAKYFEYVFGLDNVRLGLNTFDERSIFVSKKKAVDKPGMIALKTVETRPRQDNAAATNTITNATYTYPAQSSTEDNYTYHSSIEYWLFIKSYDTSGQVVAIDIVPVLPIGASRIYQERMVFTKKTSTTYLNKNAGTLQHYVNADPSNVILYRNGVRLSYSTDWLFSEDSDLTSTDPSVAGRMKRGIYLTSEPNALDIYTVSYSPVVSNTYLYSSNASILNTVSLGANGTIRVVKDNIVVMDAIRGSKVIDRADVYLSIIMRRNSANMNVSPAVEEYLLATGSIDNTKFVKDY